LTHTPWRFIFQALPTGNMFDRLNHCSPFQSLHEGI
jgi:hypothetical protein